MAEPLTVTMRRDGNVTVLLPEGEIGYHEAPMLRQKIQEAWAGRPAKLVVDLSGVPYLATPGLATLVEALQASKKGAGALVLCAMNERVYAIFEIARLHTVFTITPTVGEALRA